MAPGKAPFPSTFLQARRLVTASPHHMQWLKFELQLRVGIGHSILEDLRHSIGLHHYLMRKVVKRARGDKEKKAVSKQAADSSKKKTNLTRDYINNWDRISKIINSSIIPDSEAVRLLSGLEELNPQTDTKFFTEIGDQPTSYIGHRAPNVSWIWRIAMSIAEESEENPTSVGSLSSDDWESEGEFLLLDLAF